jgi:hypothetical protein
VRVNEKGDERQQKDAKHVQDMLDAKIVELARLRRPRRHARGLPYYIGGFSIRRLHCARTVMFGMFSFAGH